MKTATISFRKGKGNINHNNRKFLTNNIDKTKVKDNKIYVQKDLREFYKDIFQPYVDEYNAKQKRADRKIDSYYDKIEKSKQEKLFYEIVVQVGDKDFKDKETCKHILQEYVLDFEKRNPNLKVFNAVMHNDETTPHLHIDFVPVSNGYKKGMALRNSLSRALDCSLLDWYEKERDYIKGISRIRGIEIIKKDEPKRAYFPVEEYKAIKEQSKYEIEALQSNLKGIRELNEGLMEYKANTSDIASKIGSTIKSYAKYNRFLGQGSYSIPEKDMYKLIDTLSRQSSYGDHDIFKGNAKRLLDFNIESNISNAPTDIKLVKEINKLKEQNRNLENVAKEHKILKSEFDYLKSHIEEKAEEKYKTEISNLKSDLIKYQKAYREQYFKVETYQKFGLDKVLEDKKKEFEKNQNIKLNFSVER